MKKGKLFFLVAMVVLVGICYHFGPEVCYRWYRSHTDDNETQKNRARYSEIAWKLSRAEFVSETELSERDSLDNWFEKRNWENDDGDEFPTKWEEWKAIFK